MGFTCCEHCGQQQHVWLGGRVIVPELQSNKVGTDPHEYLSAHYKASSGGADLCLFAVLSFVAVAYLSTDFDLGLGLAKKKR